MSERLRAARVKIESGWVKKHYAVDKFGNRVLENTDRAVSWCAVGAMHAVAPGGFENISFGHPLLMALPPDIKSISGFNDYRHTTKQDILDLYDRAIAIAEASS